MVMVVAVAATVVAAFVCHARQENEQILIEKWTLPTDGHNRVRWSCDSCICFSWMGMTALVLS